MARAFIIDRDVFYDSFDKLIRRSVWCIDSESKGNVPPQNRFNAFVANGGIFLAGHAFAFNSSQLWQAPTRAESGVVLADVCQSRVRSPELRMR